jgi:hypothetical protein
MTGGAILRGVDLMLLVFEKIGGELCQGVWSGASQGRAAAAAAAAAACAVVR